MQRHAKVLAIIRDEGWAWPVANSPYLLTLKNSIPNSLCPFPNQADSVIWTPASGVFTTSFSWHTLRLSRPRFDWCRLVWFSSMVPKTSFFLWLAVRERLGTQDRLRHPIPDILCLLCSVVQENHDHLFFGCPSTFQIWSSVCDHGGFLVSRLPWRDLITWASAEWAGSSLAKLICWLCLTSKVYFIWSESNRRFHNSGYARLEEVVVGVVSMVRGKLSTLRGIEDVLENRLLQER